MSLLFAVDHLVVRTEKPEGRPVRGRERTKPRMKKAERLLYLINLIKSNQNLTSRKLAEKCGVSERTIFRDLKSLASAKFPVYYDQGYKFLEGAFLPTLNLTEEELSLLQFAFEFSPLRSDPSLFNLGENLLAKLETVVRRRITPESGSNHLEGVNIPTNAEINKFFMTFKLLNLAISRKRRVRIKYKQGRRLVESLIEPYALVQRNPRWLVLCYSEERKGIASFDVSKIENVSLISEPFKSGLRLERILAPRQ